MGIAVQNIALASLLIVEDETDRDPRSPWPRGKRASPSVTVKVTQHCIRHPRLSSMLDELEDYLARRI
jgi:hypothetical protein